MTSEAQHKAKQGKYTNK